MTLIDVIVLISLCPTKRDFDLLWLQLLTDTRMSLPYLVGQTVGYKNPLNRRLQMFSLKYIFNFCLIKIIISKIWKKQFSIVTISSIIYFM